MRGAPQTLEGVGQVVEMLFATSSLGISFHDRDLNVRTIDVGKRGGEAAEA